MGAKISGLRVTYEREKWRENRGSECKQNSLKVIWREKRTLGGIGDEGLSLDVISNFKKKSLYVIINNSVMKEVKREKIIPDNWGPR